MHTDTTTEAEGLRITLIDWQESRRLLRPLFDGGGHWMLIVGASSGLLSAIEDKHYNGKKNKDFTLLVTHHGGQAFGVAAMKKRWMRRDQLDRLLRRYTGWRGTESDLRKRDLLICVDDAAMQTAEELAAMLFADVLAVAA